MSLHINRLLERIRAAEAKQQRHINLTVAEARDLHHDITRLLLALQESSADKMSTNNTSVTIDGGSF